ncbi:MAG TPA: hypothetical protein PK360_08545, partial [bacterium]|nr:hypothetical protein [bacterium]
MAGQFAVTELVDRSGSKGRISVGKIPSSNQWLRLNQIFQYLSKQPVQLALPVIESIDRRELQSDSSLIDPVRMALDPRDTNRLLISVRNLTSKTMRNTFDSGGILGMDIKKTKVDTTFLRNLFGPSDILPTADGLYVLEEVAERISFFDWKGNQKLLWDGLGRPLSFTWAGTGGFFVLENIPETRIQIIEKGQFQDSIPVQSNIKGSCAGIARRPNGSFLVSSTEDGKILETSAKGKTSVFSTQVFSPEKLRLNPDGSIWVLDRLMNELVLLDAKGQVITRVSGKPFQLSDFDLDANSGSTQVPLYALDSRTGVILLHQPGAKQFKENIKLSSAQAGIRRSFAYIPSQGFVIAQNDEAGSLVWIDQMGDVVPNATAVETLLAKGFKEIADMAWKADRGLQILSQNGWIRTVSLNFGA